MVNPTSRNVCPATRPATPPANVVVIDAIMPSMIMVRANMMPYHFRSGANQCCLVMVIIGVTRRVMSSSSSPPVPSTSATASFMKSLFAVMIEGDMKSIGRIAGRPRSHSATRCLLTS